MNLFMSKVRAAIRTFHPKETKLDEDNPKFNKKVGILITSRFTSFSEQ